MNATRTKARRPRRQRGDTTKAEVSRFAGDAYDLGKRALQGVAYLKNLINIETKFFDSSVSTTINSTGTITYMTGIVEGLDNVGMRLGRSIKLQSIEMNYLLSRNAAATQTSVRLILFRDNDCQGAAPALTDLLSSGTGSYAAVSCLNFQNNVLNQRFGILFDERVTFDPVGNGSLVKTFSIPHQGHIRYRDTTAAVAGADKGSIFLAALSSEATNTPALVYWARFTYTDD